MNILTSNNSLSDDSTKSSSSSSILDEMRYNISFNDKKEFDHSLNDEYMNFAGKDERYWERRRKNNAAAKRSRERRRQHDMELEEEIENLKLMNSKLQREIKSLRQRINFYESIRENFDLPQIIAQKFTVVSALPLLSENISPCSLSEKSIVSASQNFPLLSDIESLYTTIDRNSAYYQSPIDLSCKSIPPLSGIVNKGQLKPIHQSNDQAIQDEKYLDRRRRNNEAVRKCRQNKREKNMNNVKTVKEDQIKCKIESISCELEKLKSHIKYPKELPTNQITHSSLPMETLISETENATYFGTKVMKWKTKLIKADQADQDMS